MQTGRGSARDAALAASRECLKRPIFLSVSGRGVWPTEYGRTDWTAPCAPPVGPEAFNRIEG